MLDTFNAIELIVLALMAVTTLVPIVIGLWALILFIKWKVTG